MEKSSDKDESHHICEKNNTNNIKTIHFLKKYKTLLEKKISYHEHYLNKRIPRFSNNDDDSLCENTYYTKYYKDEVDELNHHLFLICEHIWIKDHIEIKEEMHPITFCNICELTL